MNFFYNFRGPVVVLNKDWYDPDPNRLLTLYGSYMSMATKLDGLVCVPFLLPYSKGRTDFLTEGQI